MQNRMKPFLSLLCIGLFVLFALGSELLEESTNTLVLVEDCEEMPPASGTLTISVHYIDSDLQGVEGATVTFFISHQILEEEITCVAKIIDSDIISRSTNEFGRCTYTLPQSFSHTSTADLYRVQIKVSPDPEDEEIPEFEETKVAVYNVTSLEFFKQAPKPL